MDVSHLQSLYTRLGLGLAGLLLSISLVYGSELGLLLKQAVEDTRDFTDHYIAAVWHADMVSRLEPHIADHDERVALISAVHREAGRVDLPPELVLAVIEVESSFDRYAISKAGARGLMQVMPFWLKEIGHPNDNLFDTQTNLRLGCTILKYYVDMEKGDLTKALARYHGSVKKSWYPNKVLTALNDRWYRG